MVSLVVDRDVVVANSVVGVTLFTALWWVMVNVPEYFNHASIYLFALLVYVLFASVRTLPSYGFNTEDMAEQVVLGVGASLVVVLPFIVGRFASASIAIASLSPVSVFFIVVVAPLVEEMFFRGLVLPLLSYRFGNVYAGIVATAVVFALFHYGVYGISLNNMLWLIILSVVLGFLVVYSGSLIPAIILHMANNIIGVVSLMGASVTVTAGLVASAVSAFIAFIAYLRHDAVFIVSVALSTAVVALSAYSLVSPLYDLGLYGELSALVLVAFAVPLIMHVVVWVARRYGSDVTDMLAYATLVVASISALVLALFLGVNPLIAVLGVAIGVSIGVLLEET